MAHDFAAAVDRRPAWSWRPSFAFGPGIWPVWVAHVIDYSHQFAAESGEIAHLMPTVSAGLAQLGAPPPLTTSPNSARRSLPPSRVAVLPPRTDPLAAAALFVATFLASPHAFVYDMPPVATAVLWTIAERQHAGEAFGTGEILVHAVGDGIADRAGGGAD